MAQEVQIVTASQIISFDVDTDADQGVMRLEVDNRNDGLNGGKTSFQPGDSVGLLLYMSSNVSLISIVVTAGTLAPEGGIIQIHKEGYLAFAGDHAQTMSYPICGPSLGWMGNDLGGTIVRNCAVVELVDPPDWNPGHPDFNPAGNVGILQYSGDATAQGYRLSDTNLTLANPNINTPFQIGVYAFGVANNTATP